MKRSYKTFYLGIILFSFLLTGMGSCGVFELFGERDSNPTKPCVELIPTPTPTPIPLMQITPTPSSESSPTSDCSDGPGIAVICNMRVLPDAPFIILPEPRILPTSTATPPTEPTATPTLTPTPTPTLTPTPVPSPIILYDAGGLYYGNLGGRSGADSLCASNIPSGYSNYRAFISVDSGDSIANMPSNFGVPSNLPIYSTSNNLIASDWADLLDGTISMTLEAAGVLSSGSTWWSGSFYDGSTFYTCSGWTSNMTSSYGSAGRSDSLNSFWIELDGYPDCAVSSHVLCIAY